MNIWTEIERKVVDGYTIKVCKAREDMDAFYGFTDIENIETKLDNGEMEFFMLRVQATIRDYVFGETYCGGFLYEDATDILTDGTIDGLIYDAIMDANVEKDILKDLL